MTLAIRPATAADQPHIRRLIRIVGINPTGLRWPRFVIAELDDQFAGCAQLKPHRDGSLELASLAVWPQFQRRGIGVALVHHLLRQAPRPLYLMCQARLEPFYQRFGFETVASAANLPPYFRRIFWLARLLRPLVGRLAIMVQTQPIEPAPVSLAPTYSH